MDNRWVLCDSDREKVDNLQAQLKVHPTICQLLVQRGIETYNDAKKFFRPSLDDLHDPFLMKDMDKAVDRIHEAIVKKEKILVYGDYDVDGTTSVALFHTFFSNLTDQVRYYIPDRYKEGYGLSKEGVDWAKERGVEVIVSLDCGITAVDEIAYAETLGIEVIVGDHHLPGDEIPPAFACLDPKQTDCNYPYKELSGAGIGFKICQAYAQRYNIDMGKVHDLLDFVVISIASDIVPITGENRVLAYYGLQKLNEDPRPGIKVIFDSLELDKEITISDLVFIIGPRINAAGRMEHAKLAVDMLLDRGTINIDKKAANLNLNNSARQDIDKSITEEALQMLDEDPMMKDGLSTVMFKPEWHKGVIGIVASRLIDTYHRPTIVLTGEGEIISGSARSVSGFNIYNALEACSDLLESFGGHKYAAGLSLKRENLELFRERFEKAVKQNIDERCLTPEIKLDAEIALDDVNPKFYNLIKQFAPFGPGNMKPVFITKALKDAGRSKILKDKHLRLNVRNGYTRYMHGIGFGMADKFDIVKNGKFDVCFNIEENHWNGRTDLQLKLKDVRPSN